MAPDMKILSLLALLGFSTQMIGLLLVNQIEDYHEDKQMNVLTSTVRWGLKKASMVSLLFTAVMSVVLLVVFSMLARTPYAFVGVALMLVAYAATYGTMSNYFRLQLRGRPHTRRQQLNEYGSWLLRFHCGSL
jgi:4-hydroxybenzoate polyprenyltransferase